MVFGVVCAPSYARISRQRFTIPPKITLTEISKIKTGNFAETLEDEADVVAFTVARKDQRVNN